MSSQSSDAILAAHYPLEAHRFFLPMKIGSLPAHADEGAALILNGIKTTTSSGHWQYPDNRIPFAGALSVLLDGKDAPRAILETTEVRIMPFYSIDDNFAYDYGEGERTLLWWRNMIGQWHRTDATRYDVAFGDHTPLICERFHVVRRISS